MSRLLFAVAAVFAACAKAEAPLPPKPKLQAVTEALSESRPYGLAIKPTWSPGMPVPALENGELVYKVFFSGYEGLPRTGIFEHDAEADATFTPDGTIRRFVPCVGKPKKFRVYRNLNPDPHVWTENERLQRRAYSLTEKVAAAYSAGKPDRTVAAEYSSAFRSAIEPELTATYRALSPEFWSWLEANGGTGPKPAAAPAKKP